MEPKLKVVKIAPASKKRLEDRLSSVERWIRRVTTGALIIFVVVMVVIFTSAFVFKDKIIRVLSG